MKLNLKENTTEILAIISALGSFTFLMILSFKSIPKENEDIINIIGGVVIGTTLSNCYGYYFGQSKNRTIVPEPGQTTTIVSQATTEEAK